ncbi:putative DNA-binding transcriptional regulator YafY [Kribbella sp. VKM Ac-2571]|uniref:helix-turn-helix transcriptional regulator n=1 Tax=Kribbella sp. VKM Ac-2571 TaxID=2512222 RepID=UPI00105D6B88|nr:YafY family protein [Kribbella sp. VKM Ac-2571]TDO46113.1 putative DNA-binding transcriptional regulator YafY [Kribbella sp. VKM Ac-2571]
MRADRLVAVLLLMQARGRVTAADVAAELEISVATARRDLEALSTAGIPVYPQPGRNGGWQLVGGARTDLSGLTATEAQALFLLVGPAASIAPDAKAALRKLVRALPDTFREHAQAAAEAVVIDPARWGEHVKERPELVRRLQDAVVGRERVRLRYSGRGRDTSERVVDPLGLVDKDDVWYLIAWTGKGQRTFRIDRVVDADATGETFERPDGFELSTAWAEIVERMEERRSGLTATVLMDERFVWVMQDRLGRNCEVDGTDGDRVRLKVTAPTPLMIAQHLAGWGGSIEVVDPPSVQAELARLGRELTRRYAAVDHLDE